MKTLLVLLLTSVLLCGCGHTAGLTNVQNLTVPTETTSLQPGQGLYAPGSTIETRTVGAVKAYPLPFTDTYAIKPLGDDLLVFSGTDTTTLTLLSGSDLTICASIALEDFLSAEDPSIHVEPDGLSYFSESARETLVFTRDLKVIRHIPAPENLCGKPILSGDRNSLYYCTQNAIFAWDLQQDLHRLLKELSYEEQLLQGLHMDDTILECQVRSSGQVDTLFLSIEAGQVLHTHRGILALHTQDAHYYADYPTGITQALVFGSDPVQPEALIPEDLSAKSTFLPASHSAVTVSTPAGGTIYLNCYDLSSGCQTATLTLPENQYPLSIADGSHCVIYLLVSDPEFDGEAIYRWDCSILYAMSQISYTGPHYTAKNPDLAGLASCQRYADSIAEKYGLSIKLWEDAIAVQPWDYQLEPEYVVSVLRQELQALNQLLSQYPTQLIQDTAAHFSSLSICLVRQLIGTQPETQLNTATGIQFVDGTDAYIILACGEFSDRTLYHELLHVMETHMWGNCSAFDRWEELNPAGFQYDYSYLTNQTRDAGVYLQPSTRAFVDTYSMSFPREDRARIMEYAMLPDNETVFQSAIMQRKLKTLCEGIRDAYRLHSWEEPLLWEQYLK